MDYFKAFERLADGEPECEPLTVDEIIYTHDLGIRIYGGEYGVRDQALLESVAVAPWQSGFGMNFYPTVFDKAAKLLFDFANYQIFVDGNKRTGLALAQNLLRLSGYDLTLSAEQAYELTMAVANHQYGDSTEIVPIFRSNYKFYEPDPSDPPKKPRRKEGGDYDDR